MKTRKFKLTLEAEEVSEGNLRVQGHIELDGYFKPIELVSYAANISTKVIQTVRTAIDNPNNQLNSN